MKAQLFAMMAVLFAVGASLAPEQPGHGGMAHCSSVTNPKFRSLIHVSLEMDDFANRDGRGPVAAAVSRPSPFSDPHTVKNGPRGLEEINSCSTAISFQTQDPVSAAAPAKTSISSEDTGPGTENPVVSDCITGGAVPSPSPSVSESANPAQPNEDGGPGQPSSVSPGPESPQESGPASASEAPEAGSGGESSHEANPAPTGDVSSPPEQGQMAPTGPCDPIVSNTPAASGAANQTLTTVVVQPAEKIPSTTQALPKATETGPVQTSAGSRSWAVGAPTTVFAFGLLGGWLAV